MLASFAPPSSAWNKWVVFPAGVNEGIARLSARIATVLPSTDAVSPGKFL
jgi:hypothetical protein